MNDAGSTHERDFHVGGLTGSPLGAKRKPGVAVFALVCALALGLAGCSTPGPAHAYLYSPAVGETTVRDIDPITGAELAQIPAFVQEGEQVLGLVYDPYTDHLFVRIFPGNFIRVVDRPAAKVKRVFRATSLPLGGRDFTIRSLDRHLFFSDPSSPGVIETDLYGELEGYIPLEGLSAPIWGIAHDARKNELLVLPDKHGTRVLRYSLTGVRISELQLEAPVQGVSLAYDSEEQTHFASLADGSAIGVFNAKGRLLRKLSRPAAEREVFLDIGPRSLLRMF